MVILFNYHNNSLSRNFLLYCWLLLVVLIQQSSFVTDRTLLESVGPCYNTLRFVSILSCVHFGLRLEPVLVFHIFSAFLENFKHNLSLLDLRVSSLAVFSAFLQFSWRSPKMLQMLIQYGSMYMAL